MSSPLGIEVAAYCSRDEGSSPKQHLWKLKCFNMVSLFWRFDNTPALLDLASFFSLGKSFSAYVCSILQLQAEWVSCRFSMWLWLWISLKRRQADFSWILILFADPHVCVGQAVLPAIFLLRLFMPTRPAISATVKMIAIICNWIKLNVLTLQWLRLSLAAKKSSNQSLKTFRATGVQVF